MSGPAPHVIPASRYRNRSHTSRPRRSGKATPENNEYDIALGGVPGVLYLEVPWELKGGPGEPKNYREAGITCFRMSRNYMVSEKWSSREVVVFPSDHF